MATATRKKRGRTGAMEGGWVGVWWDRGREGGIGFSESGEARIFRGDEQADVTTVTSSQNHE